MSIELVSRLSAHLGTLEASACELRRSLIDADAKVLRVDVYTSQGFHQRFSSCYEEYRRIVSESESFATKLSATIKVYISQQADMKDPNEMEDTIEELQALQTRLQSMDFDVSPAFVALVENYRQIFQDMDGALNNRDAKLGDTPDVASAMDVLGDLNIGSSPTDAQPAVEVAPPALQPKPSKNKLKVLPPPPAEGPLPPPRTPLVRTPLGNLNTSEPHGPARAADPQVPAPAGSTNGWKSLRNGLSFAGSAQKTAKAKAAQEGELMSKQEKYARARESLDALHAVFELVQTASAREPVQVKSTFCDVADSLAKELNGCLVALEACQKDPSTDNQRSVAIMHHTVVTSAVHWKEATTQLDKFARSAK